MADVKCGSVTAYCSSCSVRSLKSDKLDEADGMNSVRESCYLNAVCSAQEKTGAELDRELEKTGRYDHQCIVCQKAMTRGAYEHLKSKNHWLLGAGLIRTRMCKQSSLQHVAIAPACPKIIWSTKD